MAYRPLSESVTGLEESVLRQWDEEGAFRQSLADREDAPDFVFFEGPPTANGRPGVHHILARTIKDLLARYRTMTGHRVTRIAGWDTHGLPVELEAEKQLGISGKPEIEDFGIAEFNAVCRRNIFTYQDEWERLSRRIAYWLDYDQPYITCAPEYIESVWWALAEIDKKGLLYRGYRIVPYCPRCGTGLSSHEVAQGYQDVSEPSVVVKFHLIDDPDDARILSWTTTPWTLPGNLALAVGRDIEYLRVRILEDGAAQADARTRSGPGGASPGEVLIVAKARAEAVLDHPYAVIGELSGSDLVGARYRQLFPGALERGGSQAAWTVLAADFVTTGEGTGVVHTAVMYGEDDFRLGVEYGLPQHHTVDEEGRFTEEVPGGLAGRQVKDRGTERAIRDWLVEHDLLYRRDMYEHTYPHCWRCASALLYMARHSWYIRTTAVKDQLIAHSASVDWHPPEIGSGRMGEWLANNVDWALSRERYWGTPLPIWRCSAEESHRTVVGSFEELSEHAGTLADDFDPHRPGIDEIVWGCTRAGCKGQMRRVPEVADAWFDSGSMPFAQWHYPFEHAEEFEHHFPADYIAEGVDQTRGWFYSLLAISTILFEASPYRAVVVNDLILDAEGQKMSKSRGNVVDPWAAIEEYGTDVIRFYLIAGSNPWLPKRWDPHALKETDRKLFATLRHTYRFFALYANEERFSHDADAPAPALRPDLDRWILGRLDRLADGVGADLEAYDPTRAARRLQTFVVDDLSNWYVRRSRDRFWATAAEADPAETAAAFSTLHECLRTTSLLLAPFAPLLSDWLYRSLADGESAHRAAFPESCGRVDDALDQAMQDARELAALGRSAREESGLRTRQPLAAVHAVVPGGRRLPAGVIDLLAEELNVKKVVFFSDSGDFLRLSAKANFGVLGPKHGAATPAVARTVSELTTEAVTRLRDGQVVEIEVDGKVVSIDPEDVSIVEHAQTEMAMASAAGYVAALETDIDDDLRSEGLAREIVNRVQRIRRDSSLDVSDRIRLSIDGAEELERAASEHREYIAGETLAVDVRVGEVTVPHGITVEIDDLAAVIGVERASA